jgi:D-glycero-D-manno-heptose 1,7-bisphosphate phosphatase
VIATNQSGIGRGLFDFESLNLIHSKMVKMLGQLGGHIDAIFYCPHIDEDNCGCRKPNIGMLEEISKRFSVPLKKIPAIGDSLRDLEAYKKIGAQPILVRTGNGEETLLKKKYPKNTWVFNDLFEAAEKIIEIY